MSTAPGPTSVTVTCPGKVLLAGGYLVLQDGVPGLVLSTTARFGCTASWTTLSALLAIPGPLSTALSLSSLPELPPSTSTCASQLSIHVIVHSPQFHAAWLYGATLCAHGHSLTLIHKLDLVPSRSGATSPSGNAYAECAINTSLLAAGGARFTPLHDYISRAIAGVGPGALLLLQLRADNDFYSQRSHIAATGATVSTHAIAALPRCMPAYVETGSGNVVINKTGLGSSAAMVSSISAALLQLLQVVTLPTRTRSSTTGHHHGGAATAVQVEEGRELCHSTAQVAHGLAQGKVGSGFDVAAAVFGSMRFARIPAVSLSNAMAAVEQALDAARFKSCSDRRPYADAVQAFKSMTWTYTRVPFRLPPAVSLAVVDISGGSETVGMVKRVLAWRDGSSSGPDDSAGVEVVDETALTSTVDGPAIVSHMRAVSSAAVGPELWRLLALRNGRVEAVLATLTRMALGDPVAWSNAIETCGATPASTWRSVTPVAEGVRALGDLSEALGDCSRALGRLGLLADVPIVPEPQLALIDACMAVPGVIAAVVPGAGGYDALALLLCDGGARGAVQDMLQFKSAGSHVALTLRDGPAVGEPNAGALLELDDVWE